MACNIIKEYVDFSKESIKKIFQLIMKYDFQEEIFEKLIETYINVRYYHYYEEVDKNFAKNIYYYLNDKSLRMIDSTIDEDEIKKIKITFYLFGYVLYFDGVKEIKNENDLLDKLLNYRITKIGNKHRDGFKESLRELLKNSEERKMKFIKSFECDTFFLKESKTNISDLFNVGLGYEIKFPKLYSNYAIEKAFNKGLINEQKLYVEYSLVTVNILNEIIIGDFKTNYLVDFTKELLDKKTKIKRVLNIIDTDIAKEKLSLKINYTDFLEYKEEVYELVRDGYKFAIILNDSYEEKVENNQILEIFKYIIVDDISKYSSISKEKIVIDRK